MNQSIKHILIIGYGFVGKAVKYSFTGTMLDVQPSFEFHVTDPKYPAVEPDIKSMDAIYICVPTPSTETGACDASAVFEHVNRIAAQTTSALVVLRSTVPPSVIQKLLEIYPNLVYMPEFLRERSWQHDTLYPPLIVVGCRDLTSIAKVHDLIKLSKVKVGETRVVDPVEASIFKYAHNTFLSTKIVFMHEMYKWVCDSFDQDSVKWSNISNLLDSDPSVGVSHTTAPGYHGLGYSGSCLPKDTLALISESSPAGISQVLSYVQYRNQRLQNGENEL